MKQPNKEIAELRRANEALERRVRELTGGLEIAGKDIDALTYAISHDVRAPLRVVEGFCQMFIEDFGKDVPVEGIRLLENARVGARRMTQLLDDVLTVARCMRQTLHPSPIRMNDLVARVWRDLAARHSDRTFDPRMNDLPDCEADPAMVERALRELLENAIKFTRGRNPAVIEISGAASPDEVTYSIRDNGAGFNARYAGKLFQLFGRLHSSSEFAGSGTGLVCVHRLITRHGGRVAAEGSVGEGAKFTFTLPSAPASIRTPERR